MKIILCFLFIIQFVGLSALRAEEIDYTATSSENLSQMVKQGDNEALKELIFRCDHHDPKSQYLLGIMYKDGEGVAKDMDEAVILLNKSASREFSKAQYLLGVMYKNGQGVEQDLEQAFQWFRRAAQNQNAQGQYSLAVMYAKGDGVVQDPVYSAKWFHKAAEQGNAAAQGDLGYIYYNGTGVEKNYVLSYMWLNIASSNGSEKAALLKERLEKELTKEQIAEGKKMAEQWVERH